MKRLQRALIIAALIAAGILAAKYFYERDAMEKIIQRLRAESRVAEVLVTGVNYDEQTHKNLTTIKFLEYDVDGRPLEPKYFTFAGNLIQFQSLVVRFDDRFVMSGDRLRGKSVYLFWKAFVLAGKDTEEFSITPVDEVPGGYKIGGRRNAFEQDFWRHFWKYAFDRSSAEAAGVKDVQIEAPGAMFIPGYVYTINIEHSGGLRIDTKPLPPIYQGVYGP